jgi:hypothetical protein
MTSLYHIYVHPKKGISNEQLEKVMNNAVDWYRYRDNAYIVYTTSDETKWQERLKPLVDPDGHLLITKLQPSEFNGWMPKKFWEWYKDKLKKIS